MRITLVQPYITTRSIAKEFYNIQSFGLSAELVKRGHQVTILTTNLIRPEVNALKDRARRFEDEYNGFKIVYLPTLCDKGGLPIFPTLPLELVRSKPDIIQCAEDAQLATLCALLCSKLMRVPLAVYQGMYQFTDRYSWLSKTYAGTVGHIVYKGSGAFVCKSSAARTFVIERGVRKDRTQVVPVGFKRDNYKRLDSGKLAGFIGNKHSKVILSVGRLVWLKGFDTAILAMKHVVKRFPDTAYVILGSGPKYEELSALVKDSGLSANVYIITDKILNTEINQYYSDAHIYLSPSLSEIFNMTMLEALGCGLPVIASKIGGMADVIQPGFNGYLMEMNDVEGLAGYICEMLADEKKWLQMSENAQRDASQYDWSVIAGRFDDIYTKLTGKR